MTEPVLCEVGHEPVFLVRCLIPDDDIREITKWEKLQTFAVCDECWNTKLMFQKFAVEPPAHINGVGVEQIA